jgi:O-antigen/teichoic acid export membrane protein
MNAVRWVRARIQEYTGSVLVKRLFTVLSIDILVKLSGVLLLPVYLRIMTQDDYGLYSYLISIILTFSLILNFGLYIPLSKFYHDHTDQQDKGKLLFTIFTLLVVIMTCVVLPVYIFHWDYDIVKILFKNQINYNSYRNVILLAMIASVCNFMLTSFFYTSEKIRHLKKYNIWRIIFINLMSLSFLVLLKNNKDTVRIRLESTYIVELLLFLAFSYFYAAETSIRFSKKMAASSLKLALPVMISAVFGIVINFGDKFFLEKYGSFTNLSYYFLAVSCASVIPLIFISFQNAWLPLFLKEKDIRKNIEKTNRLTLRLFAGFLALSSLILVFVKIILVLGIIQSKYQETIYILPFLLVSQIFSALVPLYSNYLIYLEKTYIISVTGLVLCCISLGMDLILIPHFGVYGAATASLVSNMSYLIIYYFIVKRNIKKQLILKYPFAGQ